MGLSKSPGRIIEAHGGNHLGPRTTRSEAPPSTSLYRGRQEAGVNEGEPRLARTLRTGDGLAVVVGIMVGSGIFRTPGTVAALLGRPRPHFRGLGLGRRGGLSRRARLRRAFDAISAGGRLLLNAAFLQVLPFERIVSSNLVAGDVAEAIFGSLAGALMAALALLVVLASLNGNPSSSRRESCSASPREGLGPSALAKVNEGGSPWAAMILVGAFSAVLAATGTFESPLVARRRLRPGDRRLHVLVLFRLALPREARAPFLVPFYPAVPLAFLGVYALLFLAAVLQQPGLSAAAALALAATYGCFRAVLVDRHSRRRSTCW